MRRAIEESRPGKRLKKMKLRAGDMPREPSRSTNTTFAMPRVNEKERSTEAAAS